MILHMKSVRLSVTRQAGFTLLEIVIVLAVVGALLAAMAPLVFTYIDDARRTQAQNDVNQIATAIGNFLQSTGLPPYKNTTSADKIPAKETIPTNPTDDFDCLYSASGVAFSADEDSTTGDSWANCWGSDRDTIENHLISNTPGGTGTKAYKTTGKNKWEGPYLPSINPDPWGKPYLVNIGQMDPTQSKAAWVLSAGANGTIETSLDQSAGASITASGDDIIARVK